MYKNDSQKTVLILSICINFIAGLLFLSRVNFLLKLMLKYKYYFSINHQLFSVHYSHFLDEVPKPQYFYCNFVD